MTSIMAAGVVPDVVFLGALAVMLAWDGGDDAWQTVLFTAIAFAELAGGSACAPSASGSGGSGC